MTTDGRRQCSMRSVTSLWRKLWMTTDGRRQCSQRSGRQMLVDQLCHIISFRTRLEERRTVEAAAAARRSDSTSRRWSVLDARIWRRSCLSARFMLANDRCSTVWCLFYRRIRTIWYAVWEREELAAGDYRWGGVYSPAVKSQFRSVASIQECTKRTNRQFGSFQLRVHFRRCALHCCTRL